MRKIVITIEIPDDAQIVSPIEKDKPTLFDKVRSEAVENPYINGMGEPLPWETPKKKRGRPKGVKNREGFHRPFKSQAATQPDTKPLTEGMIYTLQKRLHLMDDQIAKLTFDEARIMIGEYYKIHPRQ